MYNFTSNQYETLCFHIDDLVTCIENIKLHRDKYTIGSMDLDISKDTREEIITYLNNEQKSLEKELKFEKQILINLKKKYPYLNM